MIACYVLALAILPRVATTTEGDCLALVAKLSPYITSLSSDLISKNREYDKCKFQVDTAMAACTTSTSLELTTTDLPSSDITTLNTPDATTDAPTTTPDATTDAPTTTPDTTTDDWRTTSRTTPVYAKPYNLTICDFEKNCGYSVEMRSKTWLLGSGRTGKNTGPIADHTYGSLHGHYMFINATDFAESFTSNVFREREITSPMFKPAQSYCITFWYNMHGKDIGYLKVYAKTQNSQVLGNPIQSFRSDQGPHWKHIQFNLNQQYSGKPFQLVFEAATTAHSSLNSLLDTEGNIAIDDIYVYDIPCNKIPKCPKNSHEYQANNVHSCYTFHNESKNWYNAVATCRKSASTNHLVSIKSKDEFYRVKNLINYYYNLHRVKGWYTSGSKETESGAFQWTVYDSPTNFPVDFWAKGQPDMNTPGKNCVAMRDNYKWENINCNEKRPFICEDVGGPIH